MKKLLLLITNNALSACALTIAYAFLLSMVSPVIASEKSIIECVPNESSFSQQSAMMKALGKLANDGEIKTHGSEKLTSKHGINVHKQTITTSRTVKANAGIDYFSNNNNICAKIKV
ncbi:hypothetical protein CTM88_20670 [Photobacterium aquimaris]|uniref:Uncharacterized protein n=1 Tax=Photobacterium aquimaris TaxID=512643 RepID=A0A2T3IED3_9GAMM|nr:hypothetical protein [Photobacterium aquimaris]OBU19980.1 hypothetical protein AYY20_16745 [Photobacterium aquimaris]PSU21750.1 hypothetical protein CTM88_20670 [Photobacterium aquimaris]